MNDIAGQVDATLRHAGYGDTHPPGVVYAVDRSLRCTWHNRGWDDFARANGAGEDFERHWGVGCNVLDAVAGPIRAFYDYTFGVIMERGRPWERAIECSSAEVFRAVRLRMLPLPDGSGIVIVGDTMLERPHDPVARPASAAVDARYRGADGIIVQCGHCVRVRRVSDVERWDWVPGFVERIPDNVSHSLCPVCLEYFFPDM